MLKIPKPELKTIQAKDKTTKKKKNKNENKNRNTNQNVNCVKEERKSDCYTIVVPVR